MNTQKTNVIERIKDYLLSGGVWNPELAIHDNVRDLIIDCRTEIERLQSERSELRKKCAEWIYNFRGLRTLTQQLDEENNDLLDEQDKLKDWKESALVEFNKIQTQEIGEEIGAVLGSSIHEQILPAIKKLKKQADAARDCLALSRDNCVLLHKQHDEAVDMVGKLTQRGVEFMNEHLALQRERRGLVDKLKEAVEIGSEQAVQFDRLMVAMGAEELTIDETIALWNDTRKERDEAHSILEQVTDRLEEATIKIIKLQSELDSAKNAFSEILKTNEDTPVLTYQKMEDIARNALKK
jgi:chromosome segregation ATPase